MKQIVMRNKSTGYIVRLTKIDESAFVYEIKRNGFDEPERTILTDIGSTLKMLRSNGFVAINA